MAWSTCALACAAISFRSGGGAGGVGGGCRSWPVCGLTAVGLLKKRSGFERDIDRHVVAGLSVTRIDIDPRAQPHRLSLLAMLADRAVRRRENIAPGVPQAPAALRSTAATTRQVLRRENG